MSKHTPGPWFMDKYGNVKADAGRGPLGTVAFCGLTLRSSPEACANARLMSQSPRLLEALTMGAQMNTPDFLDWIADRLVNVYGESDSVDFVLSLRERAAAGRAAIEATKGNDNG